MALSKMMQHYLELKENYKDAIVFYRLGDFYEMFFEDAETASSILGLVLTGRDCGLEKRAPMCGIPYHSASNYIAKLLDKGYKVAICEQLSDPKPGEIVKRDVIRVITPGTVMEENILKETQNNYIASVCSHNKTSVGLSWLDLSTGEFNMAQYNGENAWLILNNILAGIKPSEIICNKIPYEISNDLICVKTGIVPKFYKYFEANFELNSATQTILKQLQIASIKILNCSGMEEGLCASGALLDYIFQTQKRNLSHINHLNIKKQEKYMQLDISTRLNLELTETIFERKQKGSLFWVLNKTSTAMGTRLLNNWLESPLQDSVEINRRLDGVEELCKNHILRDELSETLRNFGDLERLCGKVSFGNLGPRHCILIRSALSKIPAIKKLISNLNSEIFVNCNTKIEQFSEIYETLKNAIVDEIVDKGGKDSKEKESRFIKKGFNKEYDECIEAMQQGQNWILQLEATEKEQTGIKNLKIKYNRIAGYYFDITKSNLDLVPYRFERRQTLANSERYTSVELRNLQEKILGAEERATQLEQEIFNQIKALLNKEIYKIQNAGKQIALIDVLLSFAKVALENNYIKPEINKNITTIEIIGGRHPVVEKLNKNERFVPNDIILNDENKTILLTGPNMSGKSTFMRQTAIITLMAHIGCFVPATKAKIALTDRIFTRVGASDNLGMGQSTFMVEMVEVANIIQNATSKSLLILDEIGRGTATYDGLSIAWAVIEYIAKEIKAKTLFATHYHELTELEGQIEGIKNFQVAVKEFDNTIIFLHNIIPGSANKSFGIEVAHLAGIKQCIIDRAREILHKHEQNDLNNSSLVKNSSNSNKNNILEQDGKVLNIIRKLQNIIPETLTPLEALSVLADLKNEVKK